MTRPAGNWKLKAARLAHGYASQEALATALTNAAPAIGLRGVSVGPRQVRRWESTNPPWPLGPQQQLLRHLLGMPVEDLGFVPPWAGNEQQQERAPGSPHTYPRSSGRASRAAAAHHGLHAEHPASVAEDLVNMTDIYRRFYWTVDPLRLHPAIVEHVRLGEGLLGETQGTAREVVAATLAEAAMLVGRIEFFDLRRADAAAEHFVRGLQFAGDAHDSIMGAAILTHSAFIPGWSGDREGAADRLAAARAHARRGEAVPAFLAWIDAVEAECLTKCGDPKGALSYVDRAEEHLRRAGPNDELPLWMDWFNPIRLLAFKGNAQLAAGHLRRARESLSAALGQLSDVDSKQRAVILADLAAVEVADSNPSEACKLAKQALDQLALTWYSTAMERIRNVRRELRPWQDESFVKDLDDHLLGWEGTFTAIRS